MKIKKKFKILFNLNNDANEQFEDENQTLMYSTMIYPLYPRYSSSLAQKNVLVEESEHKHVVDVVSWRFVHSLIRKCKTLKMKLNFRSLFMA